MRLSRIPAAALLPLLLAAGCSDGAPTGGSDGGSPPTSGAASPTAGGESPEAVDGPVPGAAAGLGLDDPDTWCGAVTPEQLTGLTGFEVVGVRSSEVEGAVRCSAELSGSEVLMMWEGKPSDQTLEQYAARWRKPDGVFEVTRVELDGGADAVQATTDVPVRATVGTAGDGRVVEATITVVAAPELQAAADLAAMAGPVVATYAG